MMLKSFAADILVLFHLLFILFVMFGGLFVLKWPKAAWLHIPAAAWGALIEFCGWICPLTPLENSLRRAGGGSQYTEGFIDKYIMPVIYPPGLTREMQWILGAAVVVVNLFVYGIWAVRLSRRRKLESNSR
jgi:hypothetical protein